MLSFPRDYLQHNNIVILVATYLLIYQNLMDNDFILKSKGKLNTVGIFKIYYS